jgi:hypothetical protein
LQTRQCLERREAVVTLRDDAQLRPQFRQQHRQFEALRLLVFCNECPGDRSRRRLRIGHPDRRNDATDRSSANDQCALLPKHRRELLTDVVQT